jgi:hypothetical protein
LNRAQKGKKRRSYDFSGRDAVSGWTSRYISQVMPVRFPIWIWDIRDREDKE